MDYTVIEGDILELMRNSGQDITLNFMNCFSIDDSEINAKIRKEYPIGYNKLEDENLIGDINKLGQIDYEEFRFSNTLIINCYVKYNPSSDNIDLDAFKVCLRKINSIFLNSTILIPKLSKDSFVWEDLSFILQQKLNKNNLIIVE